MPATYVPIIYTGNDWSGKYFNQIINQFFHHLEKDTKRNSVKLSTICRLNKEVDFIARNYLQKYIFYIFTKLQD